MRENLASAKRLHDFSSHGIRLNSSGIPIMSPAL
jgi:hypothetical protein